MANYKSALAIDVGNSQIKIGLFINSVLSNDWLATEIEEVSTLIDQHKPREIIISSVALRSEEMAKQLTHERIIILTASTPIPFNNHYKTKSTLGLDRIAAIAGAEHINGGKNNLVIDIGSCITYDFLDRGNVYHGGSISPGIDLRFKSMHDYTKNLPLIVSYQEDKLIGDSTENAMISGVINGITAEIEGIINKYKVKWPDLEVIICGGGLKCFESKLKPHIFASPKLVLIGLNRILEYNG